MEFRQAVGECAFPWTREKCPDDPHGQLWHVFDSERRLVAHVEGEAFAEVVTVMPDKYRTLSVFGEQLVVRYFAAMRLLNPKAEGVVEDVALAEWNALEIIDTSETQAVKELALSFFRMGAAWGEQRGIIHGREELERIMAEEAGADAVRAAEQILREVNPT
jgi:hypothetical protein